MQGPVETQRTDLWRQQGKQRAGLAESSTETRMSREERRTDTGNLLCDTGAQVGLCDNLDGGRQAPRERTCTPTAESC